MRNWRFKFEMTKIVSLVMVFGFALPIAQAQVAPEPIALGWVDVVSKALDANPDLQSVRARIESFEFERRAALGGFAPQLSIFGNRVDKHQETSLLKTDTTTDTYGFQAQLNLFTGFSTVASVDRARSSRELAKAELRIRSSDLRSELRLAYFNAAISSRRVALAERVLDRRQKNRAFMRLKYEGGSEALWSLQQADADLEIAKVRLESERQTLENALTDLKRILHLSPEETIAVRDDVDSLLKPLPQTAIESALASHPDIQSVDRQVERSRAEARLARSEFYPQVALAYQWNRADADTTEAIKEQNVLLKLEFPFFTGFSTYNNVQRANALTYSLESSRAAVADFVKARISKAKKTYDTTLLVVPTATLQLKAAEARASTVTSQYRLGLRRYLEWEDAQSKLILAEQNAIQVRADALASLVEWERAAGLGLEEK